MNDKKIPERLLCKFGVFMVRVSLQTAMPEIGFLNIIQAIRICEIDQDKNANPKPQFAHPNP